MRVEAFRLCDAATVQGGKLNVLGAFDTVYFPTVPAVYPACAIALRIRWERIEEGDHSLRITIVDADGKRLGPLDELFDARMRNRDARMEQMERELDTLRNDQEQRRSRRAELIDRRLRELLGESLDF